MIPLLHDFSGATVLVFGGGRVGARKARRFAREADVIVVSPTFAEQEFGDSDLIREAPDAESVREWIDRTEPALVVAATNDESVNESAETAAREAGALVNRADRSGATDDGNRAVDDVVVPATVRDDPVVLAVSTGGASPALSRYLRRQIETELEGAGGMAELTGTLRGELRSASLSPSERRDAVRTVVESPAVWKALRSRTSNVRQVAEDVIQEELGEFPGDDE